jgi:hypothetical protein
MKGRSYLIKSYNYPISYKKNNILFRTYKMYVIDDVNNTK